MTRSARATRTDDDPIVDPLTIVVGYDFTDLAVLALEEAITLGGNSPPAVVHVLGVLGPGGHGIGEARPLHHVRFDEVEAMQQRISQRVEAALERRGQVGLRALVHCRIGQPADLILELAGEVRADLITVGTHGRHGLERLLVGSIAEEVMRGATCPVLVMRPTSYPAREAAEEGTTPEPACPSCLLRRGETGGSEWWCETHAKAWVQPSRYAYTDQGVNRLRPNEWALW
jgi:nucleotide-binding universal stress UspA family protein